jgi:integrase
MPKLTKTIVEQAVPSAKDVFLWDDALKGFGLKLTPAGKRVYLVQYRPKGQSAVTRRYTIGQHRSPWTTEAARDAAAGLLARVRLGEDPFALDKKTREREVTDAATSREAKIRLEKERFGLVVEDFVRLYAKPKNKRWDEAERILKSADLKPWQDRGISSITKREIVRLIDSVTERSPGAGRLLFAHLRKLFGWCVERLYMEHSPFVGLKSPSPPRSRDRTLTDREIELVWKGCTQVPHPYGDLIRVLLLTGQRREEVTAMTWSEIDLIGREWIIPAERAKNGQSHSVDLSDQALEVLTGLLAKSGELSTAAQGNGGARFVFATAKGTAVSYHSQAKETLDGAIARIQQER